MGDTFLMSAWLNVGKIRAAVSDFPAWSAIASETSRSKIAPKADDRARRRSSCLGHDIRRYVGVIHPIWLSDASRDLGIGLGSGMGIRRGNRYWMDAPLPMLVSICKVA